MSRTLHLKSHLPNDDDNNSNHNNRRFIPSLEGKVSLQKEVGGQTFSKFLVVVKQ